MTKVKKIEQSIENLIFEIRGQKVMLDSDLAALYGVSTSRLNEQVKRNIDRFPVDFMIKLSQEEKQKVVAICDNLQKVKFSRTLPYAFTEHGAIMLASVLNSPIAVDMSVQIVRAFVIMRAQINSSQRISKKITELETKVSEHDENFKFIFDSIRKLLIEDDKAKKKQIGFRT